MVTGQCWPRVDNRCCVLIGIVIVILIGIVIVIVIVISIIIARACSASMGLHWSLYRVRLYACTEWPKFRV